MIWYQFKAPLVLRVSGKDATRYINNRLSNDMRSVKPGVPVWAAALTPQGRIEGVFCVHMNGDGSYILVCEGGDHEAVLQAFRRYIVADRVDVVNVSEVWRLIHVTDTAEDISVPALLQSAQLPPAIVLVAPVGRMGNTGFDVLLSADTMTVGLAALGLESKVPCDEDAYTCRRLQAGFCSYPAEMNSEVMLTECGVLNMVSFSKGCYVGQEVIERTDAIGKVPRKLERVLFQSSVATGSGIQSQEAADIGKVLTVVRPWAPLDASDGRALCFALMRNGRYSVGETVRIEQIVGTVVSPGAIVE